MSVIEESPTLATAAKVKEMKEKGKDIISLTVGEPDLNPPQEVKDAAIAAILDNRANHYTPTAGILPLRQAIVDYHRRYDGLDYQASQVIVTEGAKNALYTLFQVILDEGDEVLIPSPYWVSYTEQVKLAEGVPIIVTAKADNGFKVSVQELEEKRSARTKAIILNSPNNPTGTVYSKEELKEIGNWAVKHDMIIVADEIYYRLCYNGNEAVSIASLSDEIKKQTFLINGVSKSYAMTGWRIGYAIGDQEIINKMVELSSHSTSNPAGPSQYGALAAISSSQDFVEEMRTIFEGRLNYVYPLIEKLPGFKVTKPQGAFYVFADCSEAAKMTGYQSVSDFALGLIEEAGVAVVAGEGFGAPNFIRISYTLEESVLLEAVNRMKQFIEMKKTINEVKGK